MCYLRPIGSEVELGAVLWCVALHAPNRGRHESVTLRRTLDMLSPGTVTRLTLYVRILRRGHGGLEASLLKAHRVAAHAPGVELLARLLKGGHRSRVTSLQPFRMLLSMASGTTLTPDELCI
jgi:hypothetical protein